MAIINRIGAVTESLLIITGSMGAGKTSVLAEASDILALRKIVHAAIDLDALGLAHLPSGAGNDSIMYRNLESVCKNYAATPASRGFCWRARWKIAPNWSCARALLPQQTLHVCRLTANIADDAATGQNCAKPASCSSSLLIELRYWTPFLIAQRLRISSSVNENRSLSDVAQEMLIKAGWISNVDGTRGLTLSRCLC